MKDKLKLFASIAVLSLLGYITAKHWNCDETMSLANGDYCSWHDHSWMGIPADKEAKCSKRTTYTISYEQAVKKLKQ